MKYKIIAMALLAAVISSAVYAGTMKPIPVYASTDDEPIFSDVSIADLGVKLRFIYTNVTYTTDGSGTDVLGKIFGIQRKVETTQPNALQSLSNFVIDVGTSKKDQNSDIPTINAKFGSLPVDTNQTADSPFEFDTQWLRNLGRFDFGSIIDSDTEVNDTHTASANAQLTPAADYAELNESLVEFQEDHFLDDNKFDGKHGHITNGEYSTQIIGYENFKEGAVNDLRRYLASLSSSTDYEDINIQKYNCTNVYIMLNSSDMLKNRMKRVIDYAADKQIESSSKLARFKSFGTTSLPNRVDLDLDDTVPEYTQTWHGTVDTDLNVYDPESDEWNDYVNRPTNPTSYTEAEETEDADESWDMLGGAFLAALMSGQDTDWSMDITDKIKDSDSSKTGEDDFISKTIASISSFLDSKIIGDVTGWQLVVIVGALVVTTLVVVILYRRDVIL